MLTTTHPPLLDSIGATGPLRLWSRSIPMKNGQQLALAVAISFQFSSPFSILPAQKKQGIVSCENKAKGKSHFHSSLPSPVFPPARTEEASFVFICNDPQGQSGFGLVGNFVQQPTSGVRGKSFILFTIHSCLQPPRVENAAALGHNSIIRSAFAGLQGKKGPNRKLNVCFAVAAELSACFWGARFWEQTRIDFQFQPGQVNCLFCLQAGRFCWRDTDEGGYRSASLSLHMSVCWGCPGGVKELDVQIREVVQNNIIEGMLEECSFCEM